MRRLRFFIVFAAAILFCLEVGAFTASYDQATSGTGMDEPQVSTVKIKDGKIRIQTDSPIGAGKVISIIDGNTMYTYYPSENRAVKIKDQKSSAVDTLSNYAAYLKSLNAEITGSEKVNEYDCDIYEFTDPRLNMDSKVWLWKQKEFPVKVETKVPGGTITSVMKNVRIDEEINDSEFVVPEGVEIVDYQGIISQ